MNTMLQTQVNKILFLLKKIEKGEIEIIFIPSQYGNTPDEAYAANCKYRLDTGHEIVVFNDCRYWDYLDAFIDLDGEYLDIWDERFGKDIDIDNPNYYDHPIWKLRNYRPSKEVVNNIYKISE